MDPNRLDLLDLRDSSHYTMDSVMAVANEFSEGVTADPPEYQKAKTTHYENVGFCLTVGVVYVLFLVYGIIATNPK